MRLFILLAVLCIGFLLLTKIADNYANDAVFVITVVIFILFFILTSIVGSVMLVNVFLSGTVLTKYQTRRKAIVYQIENLNYSDQVAIERLYEQIAFFNEDVSTGKEMLYNPWLQWAVSGAYQYIDLIDYPNQKE